MKPFFRTHTRSRIAPCRRRNAAVYSDISIVQTFNPLTFIFSLNFVEFLCVVVAAAPCSGCHWCGCDMIGYVIEIPPYRQDWYNRFTNSLISRAKSITNNALASMHIAEKRRSQKSIRYEKSQSLSLARRLIRVYTYKRSLYPFSWRFIGFNFFLRKEKTTKQTFSVETIAQIVTG